MYYPKIETLFVRDEKTHNLVEPLSTKNPIYELPSRWLWTEKVDGTNICIRWDGSTVTIGGRTKNSQIPTFLYDVLVKQFTIDKLANTFGDTPAILFGEGYGPKIQKVGHLYRDDPGFIAFDCWLNNTHWVSFDELLKLCCDLCDVVPAIGTGALWEAVYPVKEGFKSRVAKHDLMAEGVVGKTVPYLFDSHGNRLVVKLKTRDFEEKIGRSQGFKNVQTS